MDYTAALSNFPVQTVITVEKVTEMFPGLPEEYYHIIQQQQDESSLQHANADAFNYDEQSTCGEDQQYESCSFPVQDLGVVWPESDTTCRG